MMAGSLANETGRWLYLLRVVYWKDTMDEKKPICPNCGKAYAGSPAVSSRDHKTKICSICRLKESLQSFSMK
jgi:hypothetical protein